MVGTGGVNSVFVRDDFPELGTDLVTALTSLNVNDFSHFKCVFFKFIYKYLNEVSLYMDRIQKIIEYIQIILYLGFWGFGDSRIPVFDSSKEPQILEGKCQLQLR